MSSPVRSSVSVASAGGQGGAGGGGGSGNAGLGDDSRAFHFPPHLVSPQDRRDEAIAVLKAEVMAALQHEVKSLDEDSWKFAGPRSQIHLISRLGGFPYKRP